MNDHKSFPMYDVDDLTTITFLSEKLGLGQPWEGWQPPGKQA
jgi:hypothetical protein